MSVPVSGEHHERAVEAARAKHRRARDELEYFGASEDFTQSPVITAIDAYFASLAEQGVVLVALREMTGYLRGQARLGASSVTRRWFNHAADALERHFGSVSE